MTKEEVIQTVKEAKELGCTEVTVDGMKFVFGASVEPVKPVEQLVLPINQNIKPSDIFKMLPDDDIINDPDMIYYATPFWDEIIAKREEKLKHAAEAKFIKEPGEEVNG